MKYLYTNETTISNFSPDFIDEMYEKGYVFTRIDRGVMHQTRSVRIDLDKFELSSENRRVLKKTEDIELFANSIPYAKYDFAIGKMAKDFYTAKFGENVMSAQKVKEMITDESKTNFNALLNFSKKADSSNSIGNSIGYAITFKSEKILHYSYPFYDLNLSPKDMGLGMMIRAIIFAKGNGMKYIYLGSLQRPSDTYKLQFSGLEWFDGMDWNANLDEVKKILAVIKQ